VEGLPVAELRSPGRAAVAGLVAEGLVDGVAAVRDGRVVLTRRGRLLADTVVHQLLAS
jgi:oxygen-independent coproporphyrinogen-3 oxidase